MPTECEGALLVVMEGEAITEAPEQDAGLANRVPAERGWPEP